MPWGILHILYWHFNNNSSKNILKKTFIQYNYRKESIESFINCLDNNLESKFIHRLTN